ncbi:MAG: arylsulfatase [Cyclobacteriaceae bacterium]
MKILIPNSFWLLVLGCFFFMDAAVGQSQKPNIILFLADDFGYGSTNIYGAPTTLIQTPNIDKVANNGVRFSNAFTTGSVCTPTRYALLTGEYSWRTKLKKGVVNSNDPALIKTESKTLPEYLKSQGYNTGTFGKWHLGFKKEQFDNLLGKIELGPNEHGFDYSFVVPNNLDDVHKVYIENDRIYGLRSDKICAYGKSFYGKQYAGYDAPQRVTENVMDDLTNKSLEWMKNQEENEPFFLYFASVAVHHPIVPSPEMRGKSNAGAYGDFIQDIDRSFGKLVEYIEDNGLKENTIILFASDNGGDIPDKKGIVTPENFAFNKGLKINGSLKGDKHTIWDGGFKIPFFISHPGNIAPQMVSDATVSTVDIYAFLAEYVGSNDGLEVGDAPDSYSFAEAVRNPTAKYVRPPLVHRDAQGRKAIRFDNWKYIEPKNTESNNPDDQEMLFEIVNDPAESKNVVEKKARQTKQARQYLEQIILNPSKITWN